MGFRALSAAASGGCALDWPAGVIFHTIFLSEIVGLKVIRQSETTGISGGFFYTKNFRPNLDGALRSDR